jgi:hypothetical protein
MLSGCTQIDWPSNLCDPTSIQSDASSYLK